MDREHKLLLKEVWFDKFDRMFNEDYAMALLTNTLIVYDKYVQTSEGRLDIHPEIDNDHYLVMRQEVARLRSGDQRGKGAMYVALTNACIELLIIGVPYCIIEEYWKYVLPESEFEHIFFRLYKSKEEADEIC